MEKKPLRDQIVSMILYSLGAIFGPLVIFLGAGLLLDRFFSTHSPFLFSGIFIAFIITNILLFKKTIAVNRLLAGSRQTEDLPIKQAKENSFKNKKINQQIIN